MAAARPRAGTSPRRGLGGEIGDARPQRASGSGSGSGLCARGRPGLACGRPRSGDRWALRGKGLFWGGVVLISLHCPSLQPCFLGFLHRL